MSKKFFQYFLEFCNIYYLLSLAENETDRKDKESLSHSLFICIYFRDIRSKKIPDYIFRVTQISRNILTVITF